MTEETPTPAQNQTPAPEEKKQPDYVVTHEWAIERLLVVLVSALGVGITVLGVLTYQEIRSQAEQLVPSPTPFVNEEIKGVPPAKRTLKTPYLRLVTTKSAYGLQTEVPVEVYMSTGETEIVEAQVQLQFDPELVEPGKDIEHTDVFKTIQINTEEAGTLSFSLFVTPQVGHQPIVAADEVKIATVHFKTKALESEQVEIALETGGETSGLFKFTEDRSETAENVLEDSEGASFTIKP